MSSSVITKYRSRTRGGYWPFERLRHGVRARLIEDRRRQCTGALEGTVEIAYVIVLKYRAQAH
jgi:hypothetical protein